MCLLQLKFTLWTSSLRIVTEHINDTCQELNFLMYNNWENEYIYNTICLSDSFITLVNSDPYPFCSTIPFCGFYHVIFCLHPWTFICFGITDIDSPSHVMWKHLPYLNSYA
jgi:hypothetical protein